MVVDAAGAYQDHQVPAPAYICLNCGAPAVDLGAVPSAMADDEAQEELAPVRVDVLCPVCETRVSVFAGEDCPNCGAELEVGEA